MDERKTIKLLGDDIPYTKNEPLNALKLIYQIENMADECLRLKFACDKCKYLKLCDKGLNENPVYLLEHINNIRSYIEKFEEDNKDK